MELHFTDIQEFENIFNDPSMAWNLNQTKCACGSFCEMQLKDVEVHIADYNIHLHDCPVMVCDECGHEHLCPDIPQEIYTTYFRMIKKEATDCKLTMKSNIRYDLDRKSVV